MKKTYLLLICLFLFIPFTASAQLFKKLFSGEKDTTRAASFLPVPVLAYAQETGVTFGGVALYSFYTDKEDLSNRTSSIAGVATFTTKQQSNIQLKVDIWAPQNKYRYLSDIRLKDFPFDFHAPSNSIRPGYKENINQKVLKLGGEMQKKTGSHSYTGFSTSYENYRFTTKENVTFFANDTLIAGRDGGSVLFAGLSQMVDSRNSNTYPTKGTYVKLSYAYAPDLFGEDNFTGSLSRLDFRTFNNFNKEWVIGFQTVYQSINGDDSPFYLLPQLGNDEIMRGYYQGRYRDRNLLAAQVEMRYRFMPRFGLAAFLGGGTVYAQGRQILNSIKPSYGGGFRYFFDLERSLSIRMDYGIGQKVKGEERQTGFYISLGESF